MKNILVLGIGNRLMMDDGIGVYVVEELNLRNRISEVSFVVGETDTNFCFRKIEQSSYIFIVDAAYLGSEPGSLEILNFRDVLENPLKSISSHNFGLLNEIAFSSKKPDGLFIGIEPYEINYFHGLSSNLQKKFPKIVENIESIISKNLSEILSKHIKPHTKCII